MSKRRTILQSLPDGTRLEQVRLAVVDEMMRFNLAVKEQPIVIDSPESLNHGHTVLLVRSDFWLVTKGPDGSTHSWCYCNDGRWAALLAQAGVERNPLFAEFSHAAA